MSDTDHITILWFAQLAHERGLSTEVVATAEPAATAAGLYSTLSEQHHLTLPVESLRFAVNHELVDAHHPLTPGDTVAYLLPFCGG